MQAEKKQVKYDLDGYDQITSALRELLNQFPLLLENEEITFSTLGEEEGIAMFPISGAIIQTEKEDVTGHVSQVCQYPFYIIYRSSGLNENRKAGVKEWLDDLGKWLERQEIVQGEQKYHLEAYPELTGQRKFKRIVRSTPAYLDSVNENKSENWIISIVANYTNEYDT